jgi:hypothetical protein
MESLRGAWDRFKASFSSTPASETFSGESRDDSAGDFADAEGVYVEERGEDLSPAGEVPEGTGEVIQFTPSDEDDAFSAGATASMRPLRGDDVLVDEFASDRHEPEALADTTVSGEVVPAEPEHAEPEVEAEPEPVEPEVEIEPEPVVESEPEVEPEVEPEHEVAA